MVCAEVVVFASMLGCGPEAPYVRYSGTNFGRTPKPVSDMEIVRTGAPQGRFQDLGTVTVTCPSQAQQVAFSGVQQIGGCSYEWAVWQACSRASTNGGDGIRAIDATMNSSGKVVTLQASVFVRLPPLVSAQSPQADPRPAAAPRPTVEERLKHLEKLKADGLISPEEYTTKRQEILKDI
jgi:hypothetical protein